MALIGEPTDPQGIAVFKPEDDPYGLGAALKICTFTIDASSSGTKRGEQLLKACVDFARRNGHSRMYMEVLTKHYNLLGWLGEFGFHPHGEQTERCETVMVKELLPPTGVANEDPLAHAIRYGPGSMIQARSFGIPIQDRWHRILFPESPIEAAPPIEQLALELVGIQQDGIRPCGNAIRKAYLCNANIKDLRPGDLLVFFRTSTNSDVATYATATGVVEGTFRSSEPDAIIDFVGQRTVYSFEQVGELCAKGESSRYGFAWIEFYRNQSRSKKLYRKVRYSELRSPYRGFDRKATNGYAICWTRSPDVD